MPKPLHELIREYPELGEVFAELENRIGYLENSQTTTANEETTPVYEDTQWTNRQWDKVQQLDGRTRHIERKHYEALKEIERLTAKADRGAKKTNRYKKYIS